MKKFKALLHKATHDIENVPLWYKVNPCDMDHYDVLTPVQRFFEFFSKGTECMCCLGARIFFALVIGFVLGAWIF